jgi:hypothetical protein
MYKGYKACNGDNDQQNDYAENLTNFAHNNNLLSRFGQL